MPVPRIDSNSSNGGWLSSKVDQQFLKIAAPTVREALVRVPGTFKCPGYAANEKMEVPEDACISRRGEMACGAKGSRID